MRRKPIGSTDPLNDCNRDQGDDGVEILVH